MMMMYEIEDKPKFIVFQACRGGKIDVGLSNWSCQIQVKIIKLLVNDHWSCFESHVTIFDKPTSMFTSSAGLEHNKHWFTF